MNKWQLVLVWVVGVYISFVISDTGLRLLIHAKKSAETLATGYPFTVLAGTAWAYIIPIIIIAGLVFVSVKGRGK